MKNLHGRPAHTSLTLNLGTLAQDSHFVLTTVKSKQSVEMYVLHLSNFILNSFPKRFKKWISITAKNNISCNENILNRDSFLVKYTLIYQQIFE